MMTHKYLSFNRHNNAISNEHAFSVHMQFQLVLQCRKACETTYCLYYAKIKIFRVILFQRT